MTGGQAPGDNRELDHRSRNKAKPGRTTAWRTERLTIHSMDTRDQDYSSKTTFRAALPPCLPVCLGTNIS